MSTQRFIVFILAIAGVIATFLPWFRVEMVGDLSGVSTSGWFTFIMFIIILFLCVRRNTTYDMSYGNTWAVSVLGIAAGMAYLRYLFCSGYYLRIKWTVERNKWGTDCTSLWCLDRYGRRISDSFGRLFVSASPIEKRIGNLITFIAVK